MKKTFEKSSFLFLLVFTLLFAAQGLAQEQPADTEQPAPSQAEPGALPVDSVPRFDVKDVYGRIINAKDLEGWIILYGFGNEDTAETAIQWLKKITFQNFQAKGVIYILIADTSKYHKILAPVVKKQLKGEYEKQLDIFRKELSERNITYDFNLEDRCIIVMDSKAELFKLFNIDDHKDVPHLFVVDGDNNIRGYANEYSDSIVDLFNEVVSDRDDKEKYSLTMHQKKRQMWKRYALGGLLIWLLVK